MVARKRCGSCQSYVRTNLFGRDAPKSYGSCLYLCEPRHASMAACDVWADGAIECKMAATRKRLREMSAKLSKKPAPPVMSPFLGVVIAEPPPSEVFCPLCDGVLDPVPIPAGFVDPAGATVGWQCPNPECEMGPPKVDVQFEGRCEI